MYKFHGISIFTGTYQQVIQKIGYWIDARRRAYICVTGAHGIVEAHNTPHVLKAHKEASLVVPDGVPLVWLGKVSGHPTSSRIYGPDLMHVICANAEKQQWRIVLYGTTPHTLRALATRLTSVYPRLIIADKISPPFRSLTTQEIGAMIHTINSAKPDILFVGLSTPKQELWMNEFSKQLSPTVMIGVGAAFDFISGTKRQAPPWIRRSGFEWMFRLLMEPKRLMKRYAMTNIYFFRYAFAYLWSVYSR